MLSLRGLASLSRRVRWATQRLHARNLHVAVVGSGPAGFYVTSALLRQHEQCTVDILERLPVPYGLVRFGVAPDHPEVKNCTNQFEQLFEQYGDRVRFYGGLNVGHDLAFSTLAAMYDATVLAYGCDGDNELRVPGAQGSHVFSARQFVSWYNGLPSAQNLPVNLSKVHNATIVGHGNVALDCARILLSPVERLRQTDVPQNVLRVLSQSAVKEVHLVGRRGPFQVSFTVKELREIVKMKGVETLMEPMDAFEDADELLKTVPRQRRRLLQLLVDTSRANVSDRDGAERTLLIRFLHSPSRLLLDKSGAVSAVELVRNRLKYDRENTDLLMAKVVGTDETVTHSSEMVLSSLGYKTTPIPGVPFNTRHKVVDTKDGLRISGMPSVYACGWCARGAIGVIASTQIEARTCAAAIGTDLKSGALDVGKCRPQTNDILAHCQGDTLITWHDWLKVNQYEVQRGKDLGKPREKILDLDEIWRVATS